MEPLCGSVAQRQEGWEGMRRGSGDGGLAEGAPDHTYSWPTWGHRRNGWAGVTDGPSGAIPSRLKVIGPLPTYRVYLGIPSESVHGPKL